MTLEELRAEADKMGYILSTKADELYLCTKKDETSWIPTSVQLPKNDGIEFETVLISTTEYGVQMGFYDDEDETWKFTCSDGSAWPVVATAWMPLPTPYEVGEHIAIEALRKERCRDCAYIYAGSHGEWMCDHYEKNVLDIPHCTQV